MGETLGRSGGPYRWASQRAALRKFGGPLEEQGGSPIPEQTPKTWFPGLGWNAKKVEARMLYG